MIEPWKALSTSLLLALTLLGCDRSVRVTPEDAGVVAEAAPNSMEAGLPPVMLGVRMAWTGPALATQLAYLGVSAEDSTLLTLVAPDTPAARAGLRQWDVIIETGEGTGASPDAIRSMLRESKPGDVVTFVVLRDGKRTKVDAVLEVPDATRMHPLGRVSENDG
ncbi:MAG: PDZ domain-containing protein [Phycisphaerales bacterium]|nr:PDZ domain-containing protein [Phycisphaerales bacterium]